MNNGLQIFSSILVILLIATSHFFITRSRISKESRSNLYYNVSVIILALVISILYKKDYINGIELAYGFILLGLIISARGQFIAMQELRSNYTDIHKRLINLEESTACQKESITDQIS